MHTDSRLVRLGLLAPLLCTLAACSSFRNSSSLMEQHEAMLQRQAAEDTQPQIDNRQVYLDMIKTMQTRALYFASLAHIDAYEAAHGATPETRRLRADALRASGQQEAARAQYLTLLQTGEAAAAQHGLGLLAAQSGDYARATDHLRQAVKLNPLDATALSDLGYACLLQGDTATARVPLIQAAELAPDNRKVISNLALYLLLVGERDKAEAFMDKAGLPAETRNGIAQRARDMRTTVAPPPAAAASHRERENSGMQLRLQTMLDPSLRTPQPH